MSATQSLFSRDTIGSTRASAQFSGCGHYRFNLTRQWAELPYLCWVLLNPSTADAEANDPTVRKLIEFTRRWGYGGFVLANLFALRATKPAAMLAHSEPIGPGTDIWLETALRKAPRVVVAWGNHGSHLGRNAEVLARMQKMEIEPWCLGVTKSGEPQHPLYLPYTRQLERYPR